MTPSEDHQEQQLTQLKQPAPARSHWFAIAIAVSVLIATFFVANNWLSDRISQQAVGATRPAVITAVRDNVRQEDVFNYYEIVHGGMAEEASAFVDRNAHEYDGMTADGMPEYLVGGDFIKTFNNDKANRKINIDITDSCPTKLDLIVDNRSSIPKWLVEDFRDTEDDLGYDERPLYMKGKLVNKCTNSVGQVRASITQLLFGSEKFTSQEQSC